MAKTERRENDFRSCTDRLYENAFSGRLAIGTELKFFDGRSQDIGLQLHRRGLELGKTPSGIFESRKLLDFSG